MQLCQLLSSKPGNKTPWLLVAATANNEYNQVSFAKGKIKNEPGDLQVHIFQDRVEIVNPGGLVGGLTLETLGTRSIPRNPLLFGMMHRMNLVEKVGSGLLRIRQMCEAYPCPPPNIEADADWYRIIFRRSEAEKPSATEQVGIKSRQESGQESGLESKTAQSIMKALEIQPLQRMEIAKALGHGKVSGAINRAVKELLNKKLIEYTLPEKPNSRLQKCSQGLFVRIV